jgi:hypothetical protein
MVEIINQREVFLSLVQVISDLITKHKAMKALKWIAWISGGIGGVFVLAGLIQIVFGHWRWGSQIVNYFLVADSFFLITIALFLFLYKCECKK